MAYERRFKERVIEYLTEGHSQKGTAETFGIGITTIKEWKKRIAKKESLEPKKRNRKPKKILPNELKAYVAVHPDAYLSEIGEQFGCTGETVRQALKNLNITRKKNDRLPRTR